MGIPFRIFSSVVAGKRCHGNKENAKEEKCSADADERDGNWRCDSFDGVNEDKPVDQEENSHTKDKRENGDKDGAGFLRHLSDAKDGFQNKC